MRVVRAWIGLVLGVAGAIACSSSSSTGPGEGGVDGSETQMEGSIDGSSADADSGIGGSCNQTSDCPPTGGGACASVCSDGTDPCARACVDHACVPRGCPDSSVLDGQAFCNQVSDCPPNTAASCASVCSDGSNPCVTACVGHQCVERGCPDAGTTDAGGDAGDAGHAGDAGDAGDAGCTGTRPNCFGNDVTKCCGQDPSGPASCVGGAWECGTAPAPGCNGTSCLALDASAG
jgi:hypothetical protein